MTDNITIKRQKIMQQLDQSARDAGFLDVDTHWEALCKDVDMSALSAWRSEQDCPEPQAPTDPALSTQPSEPALDEAAELADLYASYWGFNTADDLKQWGVVAEDDRLTQAPTYLGGSK